MVGLGFLLGWCLPLLSAQTYYVDTIIGSGLVDFSGDGGPAFGATIDQPSDVVVTSSGEYYIADMFNDRVRKVSSNGTISTYAGTGSAGIEDGLALDATLSGPSYLALVESLPPPTEAQQASWLYAAVAPEPTPQAPLLFISDTYNSLVRCVLPNSTIINVAGSGAVAVGAQLGDGGPAVQASLSANLGIAVDTATLELFIADTQHNLVRRVSLAVGYASAVIDSYAGNGQLSAGAPVDGVLATQTTMSYPTGVAFDASYVYICDHNSGRVRMVNRTTHLVYTLLAFEAPFLPWHINLPQGGQFAHHINGRMHVTSADGDLIYLVTNPSHEFTQLPLDQCAYAPEVGQGTPGNSDGGNPLYALLDTPRSVFEDFQGNLWIADMHNNKIRKALMSVEPKLLVTAVGGGEAGTYSGDGALANTATLRSARAVVMDNGGNTYVTDKYNNLIRRVGPDGIIHTIAGVIGQPGGFNFMSGAATTVLLNEPIALGIRYGLTNAQQTWLYVSDMLNNMVREIDLSTMQMRTIAGLSTTNPSTCGNGNPSNELCQPQGLCVNFDGLIVIADTDNNRVVYTDPVQATGQLVTIAGNRNPGTCGPHTPAAGAQCNLYKPMNVACAADGVYVVDWGNHQIRRINPDTGFLDIIAGTGQFGWAGDGGLAVNALLNHPNHIALSPGFFTVADSGNNVIRRIDNRGVITTIAGTSEVSFGGDGGPALQAYFNYPTCTYIVSAARILVADDDNNRVRVLYSVEDGSDANPLVAFVVYIAAPSVVVVLLTIGVACVLIRRSRTTLRPRVIGPKDLEMSDDLLGSGMQSTVTRALWRGTEVAVKIPKHQTKERTVKEFENEVQLLLVIGAHPRIVPYLGSYRHPPDLLMVLALFQGGSVERKLVRHRSVLDISDQCVNDRTRLENLRKIVQILVDSSSAVQHLHSQDIIHRDIASRNFLLDSFHRAVICDFGLSVKLTGHFHKAGEAEMLAWRWSAPESLRTRQTDRRTDVYSFGMFMYEVVARHVPFHEYANWNPDIVPDLLNPEQPLRPTIPGYAPNEIAGIIRDCWHADPSRRPEMKNINQKLNHYLTGLRDAEHLGDIFTAFNPAKMSTASTLAEVLNKANAAATATATSPTVISTAPGSSGAGSGTGSGIGSSGSDGLVHAHDHDGHHHAHATSSLSSENDDNPEEYVHYSQLPKMAEKLDQELLLTKFDSKNVFEIETPDVDIT